MMTQYRVIEETSTGGIASEYGYYSPEQAAQEFLVLTDWEGKARFETHLDRFVNDEWQTLAIAPAKNAETVNA